MFFTPSAGGTPNETIVITNGEITVVQRKAYNVILHQAQKQVKLNSDQILFNFTLSELKEKAGIKTPKLVFPVPKKEQSNMKILIIEDSTAIRESVKNVMEYNHYKVFESQNGLDGLELAKKVVPTLILLDVGLPGGLNGYDVCDIIRKKPEIYGSPFILMMTSKDKLEDVIHGFEKGVDDYLKKPFDPGELILRVKSLLRRNSTVYSRVYKYSEILLDDEKNIVTENGQEVSLTKKEYALLRYLIINKGIILSRDKIMESVWEVPYYQRNKTVDTYIGKLKNKLKTLSEKLTAESGVGYRLARD